MRDTLKGLASLAFVAFLGWYAWAMFIADPPTPISDAICTDLENGLTPFQIGMPGIRNGDRTPAETADWLYGHVAIGCEAQLTTNVELRLYLQDWGINPDAR
ncbi:MAG: hypothetical protein KA758_14705 [Acidimicrobiales bacterium]|nr:hypothetical protein [Acidimicrobiales bacterium]